MDAVQLKIIRCNSYVIVVEYGRGCLHQLCRVSDIRRWSPTLHAVGVYRQSKRLDHNMPKSASLIERISREVCVFSAQHDVTHDVRVCVCVYVCRDNGFRRKRSVYK
jgi:hypothetical protein